ncbi:MULTISPECIES: DUF2306 domain-containing protein [Kordiimonas]|uniref:DUF2306 domain-containing protein n=1 Tax=Kordiimonas TaxID=288021 RepID=UPI00258040E9|nr:DUF2306 domain-containing protein [Kordiimonas sp. UBA4487]
MIPVVWVHIIFGTVAVLAGGMALVVRKGGPLHRKAGAVYFWSMLIMATAGAVLSLVKPQMITLLAAAFTIYLVMTSRAAFRTRDHSQYGWAMIVALAVAVAGIGWGLEAQYGGTGLKHGYAAENYFFFGVLGLISLGLDANAFFRKSLTYKHRVARHLWRMCFSYFIAAGSLFTGPGATAFPEVVRASGILDLPEPLILLFMLFWLARTLIVRRKKVVQA